MASMSMSSLAASSSMATASGVGSFSNGTTSSVTLTAASNVEASNEAEVKETTKSGVVKKISKHKKRQNAMSHERRERRESLKLQIGMHLIVRQPDLKEMPSNKEINNYLEKFIAYSKLEPGASLDSFFEFLKNKNKSDPDASVQAAAIAGAESSKAGAPKEESENKSDLCQNGEKQGMKTTDTEERHHKNQESGSRGGEGKEMLLKTQPNTKVASEAETPCKNQKSGKSGSPGGEGKEENMKSEEDGNKTAAKKELNERASKATEAESGHGENADKLEKQGPGAVIELLEEFEVIAKVCPDFRAQTDDVIGVLVDYAEDKYNQDEKGNVRWDCKRLKRLYDKKDQLKEWTNEEITEAWDLIKCFKHFKDEFFKQAKLNLPQCFVLTKIWRFWKHFYFKLDDLSAKELIKQLLSTAEAKDFLAQIKTEAFNDGFAEDLPPARLTSNGEEPDFINIYDTNISELDSLKETIRMQRKQNKLLKEKLDKTTPQAPKEKSTNHGKTIKHKLDVSKRDDTQPTTTKKKRVQKYKAGTTLYKLSKKSYLSVEGDEGRIKYCIPERNRYIAEFPTLGHGSPLLEELTEEQVAAMQVTMNEMNSFRKDVRKACRHLGIQGIPVLADDEIKDHFMYCVSRGEICPAHTFLDFKLAYKMAFPPHEDS